MNLLLQSEWAVKVWRQVKGLQALLHCKLQALLFDVYVTGVST